MIRGALGTIGGFGVGFLVGLARTDCNYNIVMIVGAGLLALMCWAVIVVAVYALLPPTQGQGYHIAADDTTRAVTRR